MSDTKCEFCGGSYEAAGVGCCLLGNAHRDITRLRAENERKELANEHLREGMANLAAKVVDLESQLTALRRPVGQQPSSRMLRDLVDRVWNEATDSEEVPSTDWAQRIIDKWAIQNATASCADGNCGSHAFVAEENAAALAKRVEELEVALLEIADRTGQAEGADSVESSLKLLGWANSAACEALAAADGRDLLTADQALSTLTPEQRAATEALRQQMFGDGVEGE